MHAHINRAAWLEHNNVVGNINENVLRREGGGGIVACKSKIIRGRISRVECKNILIGCEIKKEKRNVAQPRGWK